MGDETKIINKRGKVTDRYTRKSMKEMGETSIVNRP